jgi:Flp pilus assembly protein TadG
MELMRTDKRGRRSRGVALAETAVVLVLLCMVTLGALQYGWFFYCLHTATNAARYGARLAVVPGATDVAVEASIRQLLQKTFKDASDAQVDVSFPDASTVQASIFISRDAKKPVVRLLPLSLWPVPDCKATVIMAKEG